MREIIFRGQTNNGKWVYGNLSHREIEGGYSCDYIEEQESGAYTEVLPETIGQFTGIRDANKERIFEGDIISEENTSIKRHVCYNEKEARFVAKAEDGFFCSLSQEWVTECHKVIVGNIHDNT